MALYRDESPFGRSRALCYLRETLQNLRERLPHVNLHWLHAKELDNLKDVVCIVQISVTVSPRTVDKVFHRVDHVFSKFGALVHFLTRQSPLSEMEVGVVIIFYRSSCWRERPKLF